MQVSWSTPGFEHTPLGLGWRKHHAAANDAAPATACAPAATPPAAAADGLTQAFSSLSDAIDALRSQLDALSSNLVPAADSSDPSAGASAWGAQLINKQRGVLQIHTLEGDTVTLKFNARSAVSYSGAQASGGDSSVQSESLQLKARSRVSIEVQGDLNDDELAAINNLVGQVNDLTDAFFANPMGAALTQATGLSYDSSQLADFSLNMKLKQSFQAYAAAAAPVSSAPAASPDALEAAAPSVGAAPEAVDPPAAEAAPAETPQSAAPSSDTPAPPATEPTQSGSSKLSLFEYVQQVRARLVQQPGDARLGLSYELKVKLLVASIQQSAPADSISATDANALNGALQTPAAA